MGVPMYFDSAAFIITLILMGRLLEARAKGQTGAAIKSLIGLQPKTARVRARRRGESTCRSRGAGRRPRGRASRREDAGGRRGVEGGPAGGRVHAHRRAACRWTRRPATRSSAPPSTRPAAFTFRGDQGRRGHRAGADHPAGGAGAGLQAAHRAAGRRDRRCFVPAVIGIATASRWSCGSSFGAVAGAQLRAAQLRRGADHRLPLRPGAGDAHGDHGRHRQGRRERHAHRGGEALETAHKLDASCSTRPAPSPRASPR